MCDSMATLLSSSTTFPLIGESSLHKGAFPSWENFLRNGQDRSLRLFGDVYLKIYRGGYYPEIFFIPSSVCFADTFPRGKAKRNGQDRSLLKHKKAHPLGALFENLFKISRLPRNLREE